MIEIGAIASESTNLTLRNINALPKSGGADVAEVSMSFDDFLDMINPLEHIPVISSIYRAFADETINPVSRIVGDTIYGGIMGLASAGLSALGAIGDEVLTANNDGQSISKTVVAALFGPGDSQNVQLAQAPSNAETAQVALLQTPAQQPTATPTALETPPIASADNGLTKGMSLDRSKQPYGGVMDSSLLANAQQNQALALAMAGKREIMQAQRTIRNNRFATPVRTAAAATSAPNPAATEPETQTAMQNLLQELQAMKGIDRYKNAAQYTPISGETVNIIN